MSLQRLAGLQRAPGLAVYLYTRYYPSMVNDTDQLATEAGTELDIGKPAPASYRDSVTGQLKPGGPSLNPLGRPRKGESVPELLRKRVERDADKVVEAALKRLLRTDAVGNRAFADIRDTVYGVPKQTLVVEREDSPLELLMQRFAARRGVVVEGESVLLPEATSDITPS